MSQTNHPAPLDSELTRILASKGPSEMVSEIRNYSSIDCQIEKQLALKSRQISELQRYFKSEISNLQGIVEANSELKKELEQQRAVIESQQQANQQLQAEVKNLTELNRQSHSIIKRLQDRTVQLEEEAQRKHIKRDYEEHSAQTEHYQAACQASRISQQTANNQLLDKISSLQELVMQLKFQNSQLRIERGSEGPSQSQISEITEPEPTNTLTTDCVLAMVYEQGLREGKFRGELVDGKKEGKGFCEYQEGIAYKGQFRQGLRHGLGTLILHDEIIYRGYWKNGMMEGKGQLFVLEGEIESYEGHFKEGRLEGIGCMKLRSGKRITGQWSDGKMIGNCFEQLDSCKRFRPVELVECY